MNKQLRYKVVATHGEYGTYFSVIDNRLCKIVGTTSTWRDKGPIGYIGCWARELAETQANALNKKFTKDSGK